MNNYPTIEITKEDLKKIIYFILMKFKGDPLHRQGTSAKRDLVGGYIERWFNKIAETIIFDNLLSDKSYSVVSDYFIYANDSEKNAPDILGLKTDTSTIPFVTYNNGTWEDVDGMPRVEVKVVRSDQEMLTVREAQMIDDYYVFVESDLSPDYLTAIFEDDVFNEKYLEQLSMDKIFISSDTDSQIIQHAPVTKANRIGTMRLIGIYSKDELRNQSVLCGRGVSPYYFGGAGNVARVTSPNVNESMNFDELGRFVYNYGNNYVALPISIDKQSNSIITIKKKNKGSVFIESNTDLTINGVHVNAGLIKITYAKFDRSSSWDENIVSKYILEKYGQDATDELISKFDEIISNSQ